MTQLAGDEGQSSGAPQEEFRTEPARRLFFWCLAILLGFLQIWANRHYMNPDGVSYLDIATAGSRAGWKGFLNGYWSPLYPFLLNITLGIFHPTPYRESTAVQLLNFGIYLANLACFEFFVGELIRTRSAWRISAGDRARVPSQTLRIWGYLFFLWASAFWLRPSLVTPDLLVAALAYLAMGLLLRIHAGSGSWTNFALLGMVLGASYLAKAAMFPLSFVFLACAFLAAGASWRALPRTMVALLIFLAIAAPLVIGLSEMKHRATFGETGRINYAGYLNGAGSIDWQGGPPGSGDPIHPTRQLLADPPLYEFATPVGGSYPPSYDLSYWSDGVKMHFSLERQLIAIVSALSLILQMFSRSGAIYAVLIALYFLVRKSGSWGSGTKGQWRVWLAAYAPFVMYALVHIEPRFVGEFALMLLMRLFAGVRFPRLPGQALLPRAALVMILAPGIPIAWTAGQNFADILAPQPFEQWNIAHGLQEMGIPPGSQVGVIGGEPGAYWARLAGVRIIAEVPSSRQSRFWGADPATKQEVLSKFAAAGATEVVACLVPRESSAQGWQEIGRTPCYIPAKAAVAVKIGPGY